MNYKFEDIIYNITEKRKPTEEDRLNYIGLEHLDSDSLFVRRWGSDRTPDGEKIIIKKGDVLFGKRRAYQRKVAISPIDGIFSAHGMVLRPKENVITKEFLPFFISSDAFLNEAIRISVGGLSPTINWKDIKELVFNLPPISKQKELATKLWAAYEVKQSYVKMIEAVDELVQARFLQMFSSCVKQELRDCFVVEKGSVITREQAQGGDVPVVAGGQEPSCFHNVANREANVVTISASGAYAGFVNFWDVPIFASDCNTVIPRNAEEYNPLFLYKGLLAMQKEIYALQKGGAQPHVYGKDIEKILFPHPDKKDQDSYVAFAQKADSSKTELQKSIEAIDRVIKSIVNENL